MAVMKSVASQPVRCGAGTRKGQACKARALPGKARCKFHGGKSTGAKTVEGLARISEAQTRRWIAYRAALQSN